MKNDTKLRIRVFLGITITLITMALIAWSIFYSGPYVILDPKGPIGSAQRDLFFISLGLCCFLIVPVLILFIGIVWRYRDRPNSDAVYRPDWSHSTIAEVIWWTLPIATILLLATITVKYTYELEPSRPLIGDKPPLTVQASSLNWKWLFLYPEQGIATVNTLNIPANRPIRFLLTADSPMNSFWIPQLGGQMYVMSGMAMTLYLQADETGTFFGSGANFTGEHFAQMKFDVNATSQKEFDQWVSAVKNRSHLLTEETYAALAQPGTSDKLYYSAFPPDLFKKIVRKYAVGGDSALTQQGHGHHSF